MRGWVEGERCVSHVSQGRMERRFFEKESKLTRMGGGEGGEREGGEREGGRER